MHQVDLDACAARAKVRRTSSPLRFWEPGSPGLALPRSRGLEKRIEEIFASTLSKMIEAPYAPKVQTRAIQLARALDLARVAGELVPVYKSKYSTAGIDLKHLSSWEDFQKLPPITKQELKSWFPNGCVDPSLDASRLYATRSTGSSGVSLDILVDEEAVAIDTVQGIRQLYLQSGSPVNTSDILASVYTVPWYVQSIGGRYANHFISSLIKSDHIATILARLDPDFLAIYPSVLNSLLISAAPWRPESLRLVVTNSEQSTSASRARWSSSLGVPVLDEYSSEEATRIALELPCGHYHVCEDAVILEILDPQTLEPQKPGRVGLVAVTNLLNAAMPFIRYIQGDLGSIDEACGCKVQWQRLTSLDGRANDAFITLDGQLVPSGKILDVTYRMMYDCGVSLDRFVLTQIDYKKVVLTVPKNENVDNAAFRSIAERLKALLASSMGEVIELIVVQSDKAFQVGGKMRPIRRNMSV